ncbi:hypothetical protein ACJRO7_035322 [Eucalyptus globulus]|uniref:Uncharacterized protein n=1 Tax=Eucalyptus globulus TaxID=34317 RepID=A0ABD3J8K1_EUCGL
MNRNAFGADSFTGGKRPSAEKGMTLGASERMRSDVPRRETGRRLDASDECKVSSPEEAKEGASNPRLLRRCLDKKSPVFTVNCAVCAEVYI